MKNSENPIAIFDSGVGGLTVVREIIRLMPQENIVYFGDTARVPYGIKSGQTVIRFAVENTRFLMRFDPKVAIVACFTASSVAIPTLKETFTTPIFDVIVPGARRAVEATRNKRIGIIGTETTITSMTYQNEITSLDDRVTLFARPCPLFVPLVEEGRTSSDTLVKMASEEYLSFFKEHEIDTLILGCTHYPIIKDAIQKTVGSDVTIVESGLETAKTVRGMLDKLELLNKTNEPAERSYYVSDNPDRFNKIGAKFIEEEKLAVTLVSPETHLQQKV